MYLHQPRQQLSQGDIFTDVNLLDSARPQLPTRTFNVIILSHTCDILKPKNSVVLVCAIRPISEVSPGNAGHIKKNRLYNTMYVEPVGNLRESFVDFRYTYRLDKRFLGDCANKGQKIASLNDDGQLALVYFFQRFLSRRS